MVVTIVTVTIMNDFNTRVKEVCAARLRREPSEAEVLEMALWLRQFADLIRTWSHDKALVRRLGVSAEPDRRTDGPDEAVQSDLAAVSHAVQRSV
jgi:hypothetical protein